MLDQKTVQQGCIRFLGLIRHGNECVISGIVVDKYFLLRWRSLVGGEESERRESPSDSQVAHTCQKLILGYGPSGMK